MSDRTLHIALVSPAYLPLPGGGERYVAALARGLVAADAQVTVVTSAATAETDFWNGVETRSERDEAGVRIIRLPILPAAGGRDALMRRRRLMVLLSAMPGDQSSMLAGMARRFPAIDGLDAALDSLRGVDVVHGFNISWEHGLVAAHEYSRRAAVPLVTTPFAHLGESSLGRVARNSTMNHQLRLLRDAARVLVLTRLEADGLARYHVRPERLEVIGGGVDPIPDDYAESPYFSPEHHEARGNFGVYIGRQSFDKGALHAADAVRALRRRGRDIALLLIGSSAPEFEKYRRRLSPEDRASIRPLGILSDRDKHAVLSRARFLMLPSRADSFGIVLLEAWSHGVPVVAARAGGIPGVVDDGANGLLVPFADVDGLANAVERLITDEVFAERIGEAGREKIRTHYSWDVIAARALEQYRRITETG